MKHLKHFKLDKEEKQILKDYNAGKYKTVPNIKEEIKKARLYAKNTLEKLNNINLKNL